MAVSIAICTFGDEKWERLARERALPSAEAQDVSVMMVHGTSLAEARNEALADCDSEFLIYLDADDELEPGYVEAMLAGTGDVRAPSVRRVRDGKPRSRIYMPRVHRHRHICRGDCLNDGNWITVGAMAKTSLLCDIGGWRDIPVYEDYDLWLRCWRAGANIQPCPEAIYRYWISEGSRNNAMPIAERDEWHRWVLGAAWR